MRSLQYFNTLVRFSNLPAKWQERSQQFTGQRRFSKIAANHMDLMEPYFWFLRSKIKSLQTDLGELFRLKFTSPQLSFIIRASQDYSLLFSRLQRRKHTNMFRWQLKRTQKLFLCISLISKKHRNLLECASAINSNSMQAVGKNIFPQSVRTLLDMDLAPHSLTDPLFKIHKRSKYCSSKNK